MRRSMMKTLRLRVRASIVLALTVFTTSAASASVIPIGVGAFGPGSTLTTFTGLADNTQVNGLIVNGILFQYSLPNTLPFGPVIIDGGPGVTNNITPPNIVSIGDNTGVLTLTFPSVIDAFGYGYAILALMPVTNATTIALFADATPVGSLSYNGAPDPLFTGGLAGIQSTLPFNIAQITFNSIAASAFALDNVRTGTIGTVIPEPATVLLVGAGIVAAARRRGHGSRGRPSGASDC
jgi:hypothetical protein